MMTAASSSAKAPRSATKGSPLLLTQRASLVPAAEREGEHEQVIGAVEVLDGECARRLVEGSRAALRDVAGTTSESPTVPARVSRPPVRGRWHRPRSRRAVPDR